MFFLILFIFSGVLFVFADVHPVYAQACRLYAGGLFCGAGDAALKVLVSPIELAFKGLLYSLLVVIGFFSSIAITIFEWAITPGYISGSSGLLNRASVYEMWKFIRDFFNLFFILTLLYIAFTIVFQVAKDYKKTLLSLALAALFVNFSFPITRVIIDATNVPMYYFANQMSNASGTRADLGELLSASQLRDILIPKSLGETGVPQLLMAIVFMFLFSVALLVLAVLFVIRWVALVILLIFSAVGFAASVIPGLQEYSSQWWKKLWQYALFGPATMLMLFVATRFFKDIGNKMSQDFKTAAGSLVTPDNSSFIGAMAMFSVPIIMLWFAIGLGSSMSIAGAGAVEGIGKRFSKWAGKKSSGYSWAKRNMDAFSATRKKRLDEKNKNNMGTRFAKWTNKTQDAAHGKAPDWVPGSKGARTRFEAMQNQEIYERAKANKENGVSDSQLKMELVQPDKVKAAAAAISLAERKAINTADEFASALAALGNNTKEVAELISKSSGSAMRGIDLPRYQAIRNSSVIAGNANLQSQMDNQLKKEGNSKVLVDHELDTTVVGGIAAATVIEIHDAVEKIVNSMKSSKEIANQDSLFNDASYGGFAKLVVISQGNDRVQAVKKSSAEEGTTVGATL